MPHRRLVLPIVSVIAVIGLAAPAVHFAGATGEAETIAAPAAASVPVALAAAVDAPAPVVTKLAPAKPAAEPRTSRVEPVSPMDAGPMEPEAAALPDDDPRWGRAAMAAASEAVEDSSPEVSDPVEITELRSKLERLQDPAPAEAATAAIVPGEPAATDATFTGTISPRAADQQAESIAAASAAPELPGAEPDLTTEATEPAASPRVAKVNKYVNMRAGPENEATVLTVVPAGGSVNVINCDMWCEIDFDGRRGYVYKSFISGT